MKLSLLISAVLLALGAAFMLADLNFDTNRVRSAEVSQPSSPAAPNGEITRTSSAVPGEARVVTLGDIADQVRRGQDWLKSVPDYTAVFHKHERVGETLRAAETIDLKFRQSPFSVAMTWQGLGRIAYFQEQVNDNRLAIRLGGWKRRLGWIHLDPHSTLAMQEARYPITDVGMLRLTEQLLERIEPFLDRESGVACTQPTDEEIAERRCLVFTIDYASPAVNPDYRQSLIWLDAEWSVPLAVRNFDWQTDDLANPDGLLEYYGYENVRWNCGYTDADFRADNREPAAAAP